MQPCNDAENASLSASSHPKHTLDSSWLTNAQVDLHIRNAEIMRSEVIHRACCKASTAISKKVSSVWRSLRGHADPKTGATV